MSHPLSKRYGLSETPCVSRTDCLSELGRVRMGNIPPRSWWIRPLEPRKYFERCSTAVLVFILESTRRFLKSGRDSTGSVAETTSRTGARNVRPAQRSRGPIINNITSVRLSKEQMTSYAIRNQEATTVATTQSDNGISRFGTTPLNPQSGGMIQS